VISIPLPDWVRTVRIDGRDDVEGATTRLAGLLAEARELGRVGLGELDSAACEVVEGAVEQGVRLLGLVRPPGRPAALLSVAALELETPLDQHVATHLATYLTDRGGPGVTDLRSMPVEGLGRVVLLHRVDASGAQAQAVIAEPNGRHWYLLTLAAQQADRGPELQRLLGDLVGAAVALSPAS
jgi:hypothetical protein